jgi:hypothetical protein
MRAFAVVVGSLLMFGTSAKSVSAEDGLTIIASVQNQTVVNGVSQKQPVAGVSITVTSASGAVVGTGVTDATGLISFPVATRDDYVVTLDVASLPNGFAMIDEVKASSQQKQRVAIVVTHELAHQWFGNLVTMGW